MPRRKVKQEDAKELSPVHPDASHSVLGGLAGGYRLTGSEHSQTSGVTNFSIPFQDKAIICQRFQSASTSNDTDLPLIFTHGAGGGIANPATTQFARGLASQTSVTLFQGTMNLQSRVKTFRSVIEHEARPRLALGGRSMGARAAVLAAQDRPEATHLVLVSYPLTNEKGTDVRDQILFDIPKEKSVLFIIGDNDKLCDLSHLNLVRRKMQAHSWCVVVKGADHSMSAKPAASVEPLRRRTGQLAAEWLASHTQDKTEYAIRWDEESSSVKNDDTWSASDGPHQKTGPESKTDASKKRSTRTDKTSASSPPNKRRRAKKG